MWICFCTASGSVAARERCIGVLTRLRRLSFLFCELNKLESHRGHTLLSKSLGHQHSVYTSEPRAQLRRLPHSSYQD